MGEKWNYDPRVSGGPAELDPEAVGRLERGKEIPVDELEKTDRETEFITDLNDAFGRVLRRFGLDPIAVPPDAIHFLSKEEFSSKLKVRDTSSGAYSRGHVYVPRKDDPRMLIADLSHEMAHHVSYRSEKIRIVDDEPRAESTKRTGYGFAAGDEMKFKGMNEALTELFSVLVRAEYADLPGGGMPTEERRRFANVQAYIPHVILMDHVFKIYGDGDLQKGQDDFLKGFVTGDMRFLKRLESRHPGAVKILADMGDAYEDAVAAAEALGFGEAFLKEVMPYRPSPPRGGETV